MASFNPRIQLFDALRRRFSLSIAQIRLRANLSIGLPGQTRTRPPPFAWSRVRNGSFFPIHRGSLLRPDMRAHQKESVSIRTRYSLDHVEEEAGA